MNSIKTTYPSTSIKASGEAVGLPEGTVGNSEAGHLHIGVGRKVYADRVLIDISIENGDLFKNKIFMDGIQNAVKKNKSVHLMGIISFFSSHGSLSHLYALMELCKKNGVEDLYIHGMLGGAVKDRRQELRY